MHIVHSVSLLLFLRIIASHGVDGPSGYILGKLQTVLVFTSTFTKIIFPLSLEVTGRVALDLILEAAPSKRGKINIDEIHSSYKNNPIYIMIPFYGYSNVIQSHYSTDELIPQYLSTLHLSKQKI